MLLNLNNGDKEVVYRHCENIIGAYHKKDNNLGIIVFDSLNFLIQIPELNILDKDINKISIFVPFLTKYHFEELQYILDYFIRNNYIKYYEDIILVINKYDHLEYKRELNELNCSIVKFGYSKNIDNGLDWIVHNNDTHYKGYNILIKDIDKSYSYIMKYKNNKINIIGIEDTR